MEGYGWDKYDPRHGGIQTMHDNGNHIDITTSFVKIPGSGGNGGNWGVRVHGKPHRDAAGVATTLLFSVANPVVGALVGLQVDGEADELKDPKGISGDVTIKGQHAQLGSYKIVITEGTGNHPVHSHPSAEERPLDRTIVSTQRIPEDMLWRTRSKLPCKIDGLLTRNRHCLYRNQTVRRLLRSQVWPGKSATAALCIHHKASTWSGKSSLDSKNV
jgi:mannosyl-oligosaccharide glucosidase